MALPEYSGELNDAEWALLAPLIPPAKPDGRPRSVDVRCLVNGIFHVLQSGCARRYLLRDCYLLRNYGPWPTVYSRFQRWKHEGLWEQIRRILLS